MLRKTVDIKGGAIAMVNSAPFNLFGDDLVSATELNRQPGKVLDQALTHPVTITRNDEAFALLRREEIATLIGGYEELKTAFEVLNVIHRLRLGAKIGSEHPFGWLSVFDSNELSELIDEIFEAFRQGIDTSNWDSMKSVIHEWHESAIAINSPDLAFAFNDEINEVNEVPLKQPSVKA